MLTNPTSPFPPVPLPLVSFNCAQQIHVLNGDKYKEVCPDNTLLSPAALRACIIEPPLGQGGYKPLLRKEGVEDGGPRILLAPEVGGGGGG